MPSATAADGARIRYRLEGSGPVLVLTHGLGGYLDSWGPTVETFRDRYAVLSWDVRGFGGSERRPGTPETWASDLAAVLDEVGADDAAIGGISMGGVISQRFALDSRLVMIENCGHGIPTEQPDRFHAELETFLTQVR